MLDTNPWETVQVDMIGPWTVKFKLTNEGKKFMKQRKREIVVISNDRENKNSIKHGYAVGDLVLIILDKQEHGPKLASLTEGPYKILKTYKNGTIKIQRGNYEEILSVRRLKPVKN